MVYHKHDRLDPERGEIECPGSHFERCIEFHDSHKIDLVAQVFVFIERYQHRIRHRSHSIGRFFLVFAGPGLFLIKFYREFVRPLVPMGVDYLSFAA
jgi:hypothetical protein